MRIPEVNERQEYTSVIAWVHYETECDCGWVEDWDDLNPVGSFFTCTACGKKLYCSEER